MPLIDSLHLFGLFKFFLKFKIRRLALRIKEMGFLPRFRENKKLASQKTATSDRRDDRSTTEIEKTIGSQMFWNVAIFIRLLLFVVLSAGPIPSHIAFIMDGNRRFAKKMNLSDGSGHDAGFLAVIRILKYCYELRIKYVTVYAFSIDNFKRRPEEVHLLMNLMQLKMEELIEVEGFAHEFGVRIAFAGNLDLLTHSMRSSIRRVMAETMNNKNVMLTVCVAYTSTDEITSSIKKNHEGGRTIELRDLERNMYMAAAPDPDVLVRTSGESRLSNFLLWQSSWSLLYYPAALWPEIGLWELVWAVINYQRDYSYLERKKTR